MSVIEVADTQKLSSRAFDHNPCRLALISCTLCHHHGSQSDKYREASCPPLILTKASAGKRGGDATADAVAASSARWPAAGDSAPGNAADCARA